MGHVYKYLGSKEQIEKLWQNKEALELYIARLKDFWDEQNQCWMDAPKNEQGEKKVKNL